MAKKEMTVKEYERMTKTPYRSKFNNSDYGPEALSNFDVKEFTYTGEGSSNKAGAGRGGQGGPSAEQARQNKGMMSAAEKEVREQQDFDMYAKERPEQKYANGGKVSSASRRADGIASKGKTRGKLC